MGNVPRVLGNLSIFGQTALPSRDIVREAQAEEADRHAEEYQGSIAVTTPPGGSNSARE